IVAYTSDVFLEVGFMAKARRRTRSVTFRMAEEHYEWLAKFADAYGKDVSAVLNEIIVDARPSLCDKLERPEDAKRTLHLMLLRQSREQHYTRMVTLLHDNTLSAMPENVRLAVSSLVKDVLSRPAADREAALEEILAASRRDGHEDVAERAVQLVRIF